MDRIIQSQTICATILTSVNPINDVLTATLRKKTNSQFDFLEFILYCGETSALEKGDTLVMDNATVHRGSETWKLLMRYSSLIGFKILFMPVYSPELNPCELAFSQSKNIVGRLWHTTKDPLIDIIITAFGEVTRVNMKKYYQHCKFLNFIVNNNN